MADTWIIPGGPAIQENEDAATWLVPGVAAVLEAGEAEPPPETSIPVFMNFYRQLRAA